MRNISGKKFCQLMHKKLLIFPLHPELLQNNGAKTDVKTSADTKSITAMSRKLQFRTGSVLYNAI